MGGLRASNRCHFLLIVLCLGVLVDALYLNFVIPWSKINTRTDLKTAREPAPAAETSHGVGKTDIRSMSNFKSDNSKDHVEPQRTMATDAPTIPHIIHQIWDTEDIPARYHKWIKTWLKHNPTWEYRLWTLHNIREFIEREFPSFLSLHDIYTANIFRFDMIRYLVLYRYGGMYFDLDMECLKPLDNWTYGFQCLVSEETYAHPFVVREEKPPANIVNGFIAARPGHPFLKLAIDSLQEFAGMYFGDYLHATGPYFLNAVLQRYNLTSAHDEVTILPPKYFFPTYDPNESDLISSRCYPGSLELLQPAGRLTCKELNFVFLQRVPDKLSYTDHHWVHAYLFPEEWKGRDTKHIRQIVSSAITKL